MSRPIPSPAEVLAAAEKLGGGRRCLLSFSRGKDAIAAALALKEAGWDTLPVYYYLTPPDAAGRLLSFEEESLGHYERRLFDGARIVRLPSPTLYTLLRHAVWQEPWRVPVCLSASLAGFSYLDLHAAVRTRYRLPPDTPVAIGNRAADSPQRRLHLARIGGIDRLRKLFYPVAAWSKADVLAALGRHGMRLPRDYAIWGRTFDGLDYAFLAGLRQHFPSDYARVCEVFPLVEAELHRWSRSHA